MDVAETHQDVLQNLEFAVSRGYQADQTLLDLEVIDAFDALIRGYGAESQGRTPPRISLLPKAAMVYELTRRVCEWRLGREVLPGEDDTTNVPPASPLSVDELLACLKRLRKSARFWNETAGRQGYLEYISQFLP